MWPVVVMLRWWRERREIRRGAGRMSTEQLLSIWCNPPELSAVESKQLWHRLERGLIAEGLFHEMPGPIYVELGNFRAENGSLFRLAFCESCGTVTYADTPTGPIASGVHDNWHRKVVTG